MVKARRRTHDGCQQQAMYFKRKGLESWQEPTSRILFWLGLYEQHLVNVILSLNSKDEELIKAAESIYEINKYREFAKPQKEPSDQVPEKAKKTTLYEPEIV
jgi:endonuclease III